MKKQIIGTAALALLVGLVGCSTYTINCEQGEAVCRYEGETLGSPATLKHHFFSQLFFGDKVVNVSKEGYASGTTKVNFF